MTVCPKTCSLTEYFVVSILFQAVLRMRLRISYQADGQPVLEQTEVSGFPDNAFD